MSVSLYRKHRPVRFEDIVGQDHVGRTLVNAIVRDRVSHAYLFAGPRGTGKTSTAKILAMALNCSAGGGRATPQPDGSCTQCQAIRRGSSLDVVEMDAASNRGIDDIRELRDKVHFSPVEGRMKVYIVDEVHMLTPEAFNALLKTLEEPPAHAVFVLATTEPHKVPATILSRCQRFDFRRPTTSEVVSVISRIAQDEQIEVEEASLTVIARAAGGSFRDAVGLLDQLATYTGGRITVQETLEVLGIVRNDLLFEIVDLVQERNVRDALLFVEQLSQAGTDYYQFMRDLLGHLRDLYVVKHTGEVPAGLALTEEQTLSLERQARQASGDQTVAFIDSLGEAMRSVRLGADARLELELVLIKLLTPQGDTRYRALVSEVPVGDRPARAEAIHAAEVAAPASPADIEHLRRVWSVVLEHVKRRQAGLAAVLFEGRPESIEDDQLTILFPADRNFQADQVNRGDNPDVVSEALRATTGRSFRITARVAAGTAAAPEAQVEDARILSNDELIRELIDVFDASVIDEGPGTQTR